MSEREWQIGIVGTFDVENYGDLLFPLLAEAELRDRLGNVRIRPFSYHARTTPAWPYDVTSVRELPAQIDTLDGLLIGGGFLIRFDKVVADDYYPPDPAIHHPTGYWLTPALMALDRGIPVAWNAPGMHCNDVPRWAEPLLRLAFRTSSWIAVRDEPSQRVLARYAEDARVEVIPDTAFGLARLVPPSESEEMRKLRTTIGLDRPYIAVQPIRWADDDFPAFLETHAARFADYQLLALPIGPVLGDQAAILGTSRKHFVELPFWPKPLLMAELIANASAVIGYSYHLAITALTAGVPVFTSVDLHAGKFTALREHETVYPLSSAHEEGPDVFFSRLGRTAPADSVRATLPRLAHHWDRIAEAFRAGRRNPDVAFGRFWQTLPILLEKEMIIDLERIAHGPLHAEPFQWAEIGDLYSPEDAAALAQTYPHDHFKLVSGYGGEKDYEYEARALIGMGATWISHRESLSPAWQRLAENLLSPAYRAALGMLTGCDLTDAPLEVNVFHYGPGTQLGPHSDLPDKVVTHVLYFNESWDTAQGGCLQILRAKDSAAVAAIIPPVIGNSAVLVRSESSWHAVSPVVRECRESRRSVTATFYRPGSTSSMWPPGDETPLHEYGRKRPWWKVW